MSRLLRLWHTRGLVEVVICSLCGAMVLRAGERQHAALHAVMLRRTDDDGAT